MFRLTLADTGEEISYVGNPQDPNYRPLYIELDSSLQDPQPSPAAGCYLSLEDPSYECVIDANGEGGVTLSFVGLTASMWEITGPDPTNPDLPDEGGWGPDLRISVSGNTPSRFWVRAKTYFEEPPSDDRSVALRAEGEPRRISS